MPDDHDADHGGRVRRRSSEPEEPPMELFTGWFAPGSKYHYGRADRPTPPEHAAATLGDRRPRPTPPDRG